MTVAARRVPGLDGLRGLAVLLVMGHHAAIPGFASGFVGVDVFFVLSGFLITELVLGRFAAGTFDLPAFYRRRAARIVPALWLLLLTLTLLTALQPFPLPWRSQRFWTSLPWALGFATQWQLMRGELAGPLTHLWSLSWEVFFYLVWPLFLLLFARQRRLGVFFSLVAVFTALSMAIRAHVFLAPEEHAAWMLAIAINRVDGFFFGSVIAYCLSRGRPVARQLPWFAPLAVVLLFAVSALKDVGQALDWGCALVTIATGWLIATALRHPHSWVIRCLEVRPIRFIGEISYGLYLWHPPLIAVLNRQPLTVGPRWLLYVAVSFLLAAASYYGLERRFLRPVRSC